MSAAIGGFASSTATASASSRSLTELTSDEFLKIMLSELSNQDPFEPQDSSQLLQQFSDLRDIESQLSLQSSLESLVLQNQVASAGGLIGREVTGRNSSGTEHTGRVQAVHVKGDAVELELASGARVPMNNVLTLTAGTETTAQLPGLSWDANADGNVDFQDKVLLEQRWMQFANRTTDPATGAPLTPGFDTGDFNGDGRTDLADLELLRTTFDGVQAPNAATA